MIAKRRTTGKSTSPRVTVAVVRLAHAAGLPLPAYQSDGAAGLDLVAALDVQHPLTLAPGARALVPTGLIIELPQGYEAQVRPRSGLALNHGVTVLNSPGTIDADYRGEVRVILANLGQAPFEIRRGERIAQLVVSPVTHAALVEVSEVSNTLRGDEGFGSTGKSSANEKARSRKSSAKKKSMPMRGAARKKTSVSKPSNRNR
jgi:dUTP pyrophosphatase